MVKISASHITNHIFCCCIKRLQNECLFAFLLGLEFRSQIVIIIAPVNFPADREGEGEPCLDRLKDAARLPLMPPLQLPPLPPPPRCGEE